MELPESYIVVDFETKDEFISGGYGSGFVFDLNHDLPGFTLLGMGVYYSATQSSEYITDQDEMRKVIEQADTLVFHNAMYDVGCILSLFKGKEFSLDKYTIYDTMVLMKLYRQDLFSYSLDACCKAFGLENQKGMEELVEHAWNSGLYQQIKKEETGRNVHSRPANNLIYKTVMKNLDLMDVAVVGEYCIDDCLATNELFTVLLERLESYNTDLFSDMAKALMEIKLQGARVDLKQARKIRQKLKAEEDDIVEEIFDHFGVDLNINSPYRLAEFLELVNITDYPRTDKGNPSISTDYLESLDNEWTKKVAKARIANKIRRSFINKIIKYQGFNNNLNGDIGRMYPTLNVLGAVRTGRFTSSGGGHGSYELNIQQIPSARTELGKVCRSLFLPEEGETWVSADFSNQEPRIQVHYAVLLRCQGADQVAKDWTATPEESFHMKVAEFTGLSKQEAKTINLGLSYGMGEGKLCANLGLPTVPKILFNGVTIQTAGPEGKAILDQYHRMLPFMKEVTETVNNRFKTKGKVRTLGGRILKLNPYFEGDHRKGFSKLIQGSGADQTMKALVDCWKAGLKIINTVHDEINITTKDVDKDSKVLKETMENAIPITVPMVAEVASGKNWGEAK